MTATLSDTAVEQVAADVAAQQRFCEQYHLTSPVITFGQASIRVDFVHDHTKPLWRPNQAIQVAIKWAGGQTAFKVLHPGSGRTVYMAIQLTPAQIAQLADNSMRASVFFVPGT